MHTVEPSKIDLQIIEIDKVICRHIRSINTSPRGMISQDILSQLRNFVEHIMLKFYSDGHDIDNSYENICKSIDFVKTQGKFKSLSRFHQYLQIVASHYTLNEENSERLMLKYYEFLLKIKNLMDEHFSFSILENLDDFPLNTDKDTQEYYEKIVTKVKRHNIQNVANSDKYYIQKIKPFFVSQEIYYEITFTPANDHASKFNRVIAFTSLEITANYAVKFLFNNDSIEILGKTMPILIITGWEVAIRDCEFKNFTNLIRGRAISTSSSEQRGISQFLSISGFNLTELLDFSDLEFQRVRREVTKRVKSITFFEDLEYCRDLIKTDAPGSNLLRYLLYHMNNKIIKKQSDHYSNSKLSGLYVKNGCIPFDSMPFIYSPIGHNPRLGDLFSCLNSKDKRHELLARLVRNNTEIKGQIFTTIKDITGFGDITLLVQEYNDALWWKHYENSKLVIENGQIFINSYKKNTHFIISRLKELAQNGVQNYSNSVCEWLNQPNNGVDCDEKKDALIKMFESSHVALIYGSAGTGKSTLINHIAHFFAEHNKLFLAQTNPAIDNLKRRVTASNCEFSTVTRFLMKQSINTEYDLLIIDESSTVNNKDMVNILKKASYQLLILVGDSFQIASIRFGNWFEIARAFIPQSSIYELTKPYRSSDENLLKLWDRVRKMDDTILELIARHSYSTALDVSIFAPSEDDEIILCLNYDGLYGINNVNRFLQENNTNYSVTWGVQRFKINDPVLFNGSDRFAPVIYNNMKGRIVGIRILDINTPKERIQFDIELDKVINGIEAFGQDFELMGNAESGNSIIRFCVNKIRNTDEDDDGSSSVVVPFQVSYAVSIHKAQGLEYSSVKIVITDEVDELISHSIFYTAITRAKNKLKIFWTPEVEKKVLSVIKPRDNTKDINLLNVSNKGG